MLCSYSDIIFIWPTVSVILFSSSVTIISRKNFSYKTDESITVP